MKKVLVAFDGCNYSKGAVELARRLNEQEPVLLVASFLPKLDISASWSYATGNAGALGYGMEDFYTEEIEKHILAFEEECRQHGIEYRVHRSAYNTAIPQLKKESRFADLLILGSESFFRNTGFGAPNEFLRMTIQDAECPVLLVPEHFNFPRQVILGYDGSQSAVFAIKQFAYLFPGLAEMDTMLVYATAKAEGELPDREYITELVARHYPRLTVNVLNSLPGKHFDNWLNSLTDAILVTGSYGRSDLSLMFKRSFSASVISERQFPVFIAHC